MKRAFRATERVDSCDAIVFGSHDHLLGVYQRPTSRQQHTGLAVLLLTPGMLHSAGPFRLHVRLAEALAAAGLASLRFDLSGIGESLAIGTAGTSLDRAASEVTSAIDMLQEQYGVERVAVFGLCSGADDAIYAALREPRVVGVFATDGCGYRTGAYYWHRFLSCQLPKLLRLHKWWQLVRSALRLRPDAPVTLQLGDDVREFPSRDVAADQLLSLADRDVRLHFHYTGGVGEYYSYEKQFADMFPELKARSQITSSFAPESDHVGFLCEHRDALVSRAVTFFSGLGGLDLQAEIKQADTTRAAVAITAAGVFPNLAIPPAAIWTASEGPHSYPCEPPPPRSGGLYGSP